MQTRVDETNLHVRHTCREKRFNFDLTGADFDIIGSEMDENQDYALREAEESNNFSLEGDDYYRQIELG